MSIGYNNVLNGFKQPTDSTSGINKDNQLYVYGSLDINGNKFTTERLLNVLKSNTITTYNGAGAIDPTGIALIAGGTGFVLSLVAPTEGVLLDILMISITSGTVTIKLPTGVTFDGTNNTATFNAANDELLLGYKSATQWQIVKNVSVTLSIT